MVEPKDQPAAAAGGEWATAAAAREGDGGVADYGGGTAGCGC